MCWKSSEACCACSRSKQDKSGNLKRVHALIEGGTARGKLVGGIGVSGETYQQDQKDRRGCF